MPLLSLFLELMYSKKIIIFYIIIWKNIYSKKGLGNKEGNKYDKEASFVFLCGRITY